MIANYLPLFIELRQRFFPIFSTANLWQQPESTESQVIFLLLHLFVIISNHFFAFPDDLNLPIKYLTIEQKRFIANMLNDKDSYGKQFILEMIHLKEGLVLKDNLCINTTF